MCRQEVVNFKFDFPVQDAEAGGQKATKIEGSCHSLRDCASERLLFLQISSLSNAAESNSLKQLTRTVRHAFLIIILAQKVCPGICVQMSAAFANTAHEELDGLVAIFQKVAVPDLRMFFSMTFFFVVAATPLREELLECCWMLVCGMLSDSSDLCRSMWPFFQRVLWGRS